MRKAAAVLFLIELTAAVAFAQTTARDHGPDGLEAWTDDRHTKQFRRNTEPLGIVIARHGKVIRRIGHKDGGPFFWDLVLLPDGKRIAFSSGPFHFSLTCTLMDIQTGEHLQDYDCFSVESVEKGPEWVQDLFSSSRDTPAKNTPQ